MIQHRNAPEISDITDIIALEFLEFEKNFGKKKFWRNFIEIEFLKIDIIEFKIILLKRSKL